MKREKAKRRKRKIRSEREATKERDRKRVGEREQRDSALRPSDLNVNVLLDGRPGPHCAADSRRRDASPRGRGSVHQPSAAQRPSSLEGGRFSFSRTPDACAGGCTRTLTERTNPVLSPKTHRATHHHRHPPFYPVALSRSYSKLRKVLGTTTYSFSSSASRLNPRTHPHLSSLLVEPPPALPPDSLCHALLMLLRAFSRVPLHPLARSSAQSPTP